MEELEIQHSQALAKPQRETISHNSLLEALPFALAFIGTISSVQFSLFFTLFISHCCNNPLDRNINSTTNLVHRTTVVIQQQQLIFCTFVPSVELQLRVTRKPYPSFSVNPQLFALQYKKIPFHRMTHKYRLCKLRAFVVLEPHQVLVQFMRITDRSPRYNNNTNTRENKTLSDFLMLYLFHRKIQRQTTHLRN